MRSFVLVDDGDDTIMMTTQQLFAQDKVAYGKIEPRCRYFGICGGCALQDLAYEDQLILKRDRLRRVLARVPGADRLEVAGLEDPWRYRNKAEFTFGQHDDRLVLGYHAARSFWRIVDLEDCLLLPESAIAVVRDALALATETGLPSYQPRTHQGYFRYLLIRVSQSTGHMLVCLMTTSGRREVIEPMAHQLLARHPHVVSVYWGVTDGLADVAQPQELFVMAGAPYLEDRLGPFSVQLHPLSFIQPSSRQADRLYRDLMEDVAQQAGEIAWDVYCGVGIIGLYLARRFKKVYGIDIEPHHIELGARNAAANGADNIRFIAGRAEVLLRDRRTWLAEAKPDVIVVDPPRSGLHLDAASSLLAARPRTLAYVSCNAQALARDLAVLTSSYPRYEVSNLRAYDMFPQTNHVEVLAALRRI